MGKGSREFQHHILILSGCVSFQQQHAASLDCFPLSRLDAVQPYHHVGALRRALIDGSWDTCLPRSTDGVSQLQLMAPPGSREELVTRSRVDFLGGEGGSKNLYLKNKFHIY